jgi:hypothetical protein
MYCDFHVTFQCVSALLGKDIWIVFTLHYESSLCSELCVLWCAQVSVYRRCIPKIGMFRFLRQWFSTPVIHEQWCIVPIHDVGPWCWTPSLPSCVKVCLKMKTWHFLISFGFTHFPAFVINHLCFLLHEITIHIHCSFSGWVICLNL